MVTFNQLNWSKDAHGRVSVRMVVRTGGNEEEAGPAANKKEKKKQQQTRRLEVHHYSLPWSTGLS